MQNTIIMKGGPARSAHRYFRKESGDAARSGGASTAFDAVFARVRSELEAMQREVRSATATGPHSSGQDGRQERQRSTQVRVVALVGRSAVFWLCWYWDCGP